MLCLALFACDQDWLGLACRDVEGPYCLERLERDQYFLRDRRQRDGLDQGGVLGGAALRLTRTPGLILVERQATHGAEVEWMLVNVAQDTVIGPLSQADVDARSALPRAMEAVPSALFWKQLSRTGGSR